jgi:hypothetical protein
MIRSRAWPLIAVGMLAAACSGGQPSTAAAAQLRVLAARYSAIALVGNRGLESLDALDALAGRDHDHLVAARADLRDAAATERRFDRSLLAIAFPPAIEATARALVTANESRATLTSEAATSVSLEQLRRFERQLSAANARVEQWVRTIRKQLGLPHPATS